MTMKHLTPAAVAAAAVLGMAGIASAQDAGSIGAGVSSADNRGAVAAGVAASHAQAAQERRDERRARRDRDRRDRGAEVVQPNTTSTYGTGAVYTDRNSTSAAVSTGGTASGTGVNSTSSTVDAYGETSRDGTSADIYGNSTATSGEEPRRRRPQ